MSKDGPSSGIIVDVAIESTLWEAFSGAETAATTAIAATLQRVEPGLLDETEISLLLCDDAFIRDLNKNWRGQDKPTNVLSFPAAGDFSESRLLGDIAVAYETLAREAAAEGKPLAAHFSHLIVHGLLHLLGHDHEAEAEAEIMEGLEREILASLGIADPYRATLVADAGAA